MTALAVALLAASLAAPPNPLPDNKSPIDSLSYSFGGGGLVGAGGSLTISADGKVAYFFSSDPFTGSGGRVVQQKWELTKDELKELFTKLVADGLLDTDAGTGPALFGGIRVTSGRWRMNLDADKVPEKAMRHLRPLLAKADPVKWGEKPAAPKVPPKPGVMMSMVYHFTPKMGGDQITLVVGRDGKLWYRRQPPIAKAISLEWTIPAKDAEALLDALVADGLFDLADAGPGKFPYHMVDAQVGRWQTSFHPKEFPEKLTKQLLPHLKKADAEFWK
jgi:hypothetical protein